MAKTKIVQVASGTPLVNEHLQNNYDVIKLWEQKDPLAFLAENGKQVRGLVTTAGHGLKNEWLDSLPDLGVVSSFGVGYDTIDAGELKKRGIQLGNTPDVLNDCVADLAVCLLLGSARQLVWGDQYVREGRWPVEGAFPLAQSVSGKRVGIVGLGGIGAAVARRLAGFDCEIRYHNRKARDDVSYGYEASLTALAEWADYLVLTCVGGPSTHHLINREVLLALGPKGTIVNVSRGTVIDETVMTELLLEDKLGFAALDVFEHEPDVPAALREHKRVTLMPHSASATVETRRKMSQRVVDNLDRYFETGEVISRVV